MEDFIARAMDKGGYYYFDGGVGMNGKTLRLSRFKYVPPFEVSELEFMSKSLSSNKNLLDINFDLNQKGNTKYHIYNRILWMLISILSYLIHIDVKWLNISPNNNNYKTIQIFFGNLKQIYLIYDIDKNIIEHAEQRIEQNLSSFN